MYLAQTNLEVDTTQVYLYGAFEIEVYLTKPVENSAQQVVGKRDYDSLGRDAEVYKLYRTRLKDKNS